MEYKVVTETVIGCAYRVNNKMGFGFLESVYEKCLLRARAKITSHFRIPSSGHLRPIGNRKILEIGIDIYAVIVNHQSAVAMKKKKGVDYDR